MMATGYVEQVIAPVFRVVPRSEFDLARVLAQSATVNDRQFGRYAAGTLQVSVDADRIGEAFTILTYRFTPCPSGWSSAYSRVDFGELGIDPEELSDCRYEDARKEIYLLSRPWEQDSVAKLQAILSWALNNKSDGVHWSVSVESALPIGDPGPFELHEEWTRPPRELCDMYKGIAIPKEPMQLAPGFEGSVKVTVKRKSV